jgi:hypothetical protein
MVLDAESILLCREVKYLATFVPITSEIIKIKIIFIVMVKFLDHPRQSQRWQARPLFSSHTTSDSIRLAIIIFILVILGDEISIKADRFLYVDKC